MYFAFLIYAFRVILQQNIIKFFISNHLIAELVEIIFEAISIFVTFYGLTLTKIYPSFVYISSALLPLPALQWIIKLGTIASNRDIDVVKLGQANVIVNGNDMTTVMNLSLLNLAVLVVISIYLWPTKISNNPEEPVGIFYPCTKRFWTSCCKSEPQEARNVSQDNGDDPFLFNNHESIVQEALREKEKLEMQGVTVEHYEHSLVDSFKCCGSDKHHHNCVDHFSLTVKKGEVFVLIGKNGSGKSAILRTIAGQSHVHHGSISAYGVDLLNSLRYTKNNFLSLAAQEPALISRLTPEEHIRFACKFMGITKEDETVEEVLREFNLMSCS